MSWRFSQRSLRRLRGVHPDLVKVATRALDISPLDFAVMEGLRTRERQLALVKSGASHTLRSRHLTGHAIDLGAWVDDEFRWDWPLYDLLAGAMKHAARELAIPLEWGGDWKSLRDGPHYQLPWASYP